MATRARASERQAGIEVEGLAEALRALNRINKEFGKEAKAVIRAETRPMALAARQVSTGQPGQPSAATKWIGYSVTNRGAAIRLKAAGDHPANRRAHSTEWGTYTHTVYGRKRPDKYMDRDVFGDWSGNTFDVKGRGGPGYVIQPTIRRMLPRALERIADGLHELMGRIMDQEGVPRRGRAR